MIGLGALVRSTEDNGLYRIRVLGDSVRLNDEGSLGIANVSLEYEPVLEP